MLHVPCKKQWFYTTIIQLILPYWFFATDLRIYRRLEQNMQEFRGDFTCRAFLVNGERYKM